MKPNIGMVHAQRPAVQCLKDESVKNAQPQWFAILPNAGKEYTENARSLENFVRSFERYFHNDQVLSIVDTTHVHRIHDRLFWNRLGRFLVEPYHLTTPTAGVLALDFVLRVNPDAWVALLPQVSNLNRLRDTWYLFHTLKQKAQAANDDVVAVTTSAQKPFAMQRSLLHRPILQRPMFGAGRGDVHYEVVPRAAHEQIWGSDALMAGGKAKTLWALAAKAMPELTRRITEDLRPVIRAVEAGRVDAERLFICLIQLYDAMDAEASAPATQPPRPASLAVFTEN